MRWDDRKPQFTDKRKDTVDVRDDLNHWAAKWDAAMAQGIFDDVQSPHTPSAQTSDASFFGLQNTHPTSDLADKDIEAWSAIHNANSDVREEVLTEITGKGSAKKVEDDIAVTPNPIENGTTGKDQNLDDKALGHTFHEKDIEDLAKLKVDLQKLEEKMLDMEGHGENGVKKFSGEIADLRKKIDELSDNMGRTYPNAIGPK